MGGGGNLFHSLQRKGHLCLPGSMRRGGGGGRGLLLWARCKYIFGRTAGYKSLVAALRYPYAGRREQAPFAQQACFRRRTAFSSQKQGEGAPRERTIFCTVAKDPYSRTVAPSGGNVWWLQPEGAVCGQVAGLTLLKASIAGFYARGGGRAQRHGEGC